MYHYIENAVTFCFVDILFEIVVLFNGEQRRRICVFNMNSCLDTFQPFTL